MGRSSFIVVTTATNADALVAELMAIGDSGRAPRRHSRGTLRLVSYSRPRLWFIRDEMEWLPPDGALLLNVTPTRGASFWVRMTRREFEETFGHILTTRSWLGPGEYHYSTFPKRRSGS
jgi:hypothetical protein